MPEVLVDHPLLKELLQFGEEAAERFSGEHDAGLLRLNLQLEHRLRHDSWTPMNTLTFARSLGSFSFIVVDGVVTEESPIFYSNQDGAFLSHVVARDLRSFLRTGLQNGFMHHRENWGYRLYGNDPFDTLQLTPRSAEVRDFLAKRFELTPYRYSPEELQALGEQYDSLLIFPPANA